MIYYVDTSVIVSALTNETATLRAQTWLAAREPEDLAISEWVATEISAALSVKLRRGELTADERTAALAAFHRTMTETFTVVPVLASDFRSAARLADRSAAGLRAGDALHLALAAEHGAVMATGDRRLHAAATAFGLRSDFVA